MIKLQEAQPVCIAIQVNVQVNVWLATEGHDIPHDVTPDVKDQIGLDRTIALPERLDNSVAIALCVEDMSERCVEALSARLLNRLSPDGN